MHGVRRHIAGWTAAWVLVQAAAMSATPVASYGLSVSADAELPECCRNLKTGQTCPMHQHPHSESDTAEAQAEHACHLAAACPPLDAPLLSLTAGFGFLAAVPILSTRTPITVELAGPEPQPLTRAVRPDAPPPRV